MANSKFVDDCLKDLRELNNFIDIPLRKYKATQAKIIAEGDDHEHMKTVDFVDMCLNIC